MADEVIDPRGRAATGKFVKGHTFKPPGRPPKPKAERVEYLSVLRQALTEDEALAIIKRAILDAKGGSRHARQWLFAHVMPQLPRMNTHEFSIFEPTVRKNDGTDEVTDDLRTHVDCMTPDEFEMFMTVTQRVKDYKAGLLVRPRWNITSLVPAGSISKDDEWTPQ